MSLSHLELFAGIGGFALASQWAGFTHECFVERDEFCQRVLRKHWPMVPIHDDVTTFSGFPYRGVTLLTGGFPCQDVSIANPNAVGVRGERTGLVTDVFRIIEECRPSWVVLENVPGIRTRGSDFVLSSLEKIGYPTRAFVVGAWLTGAPFVGNRVFFVGSASESVGRRAWLRLEDPEAWKAEPSGLDSGERARQTTYSGVLGISDGVPSRMDRDRNRALGNAVCPAQVYPVLKVISDFEREDFKGGKR